MINDLKVKDEDFAGKNIQSISEDTVIGRAEELKKLFDAPAQEVMAEKFNALIDFLTSENAGAVIGTPELENGSGTTIADQLTYLLNEMKNKVIGALGFEPVRYDAVQDLTESEKDRARKNISAVSAGRTINGKDLSADVSLELEDIGGVLSVEKGGTGADTPAKARQSMSLIGQNPVTSSAQDTAGTWIALGSGAAFFNMAGCLTDQPYPNGTLINVVSEEFVAQLFISRKSAPSIFLRCGTSVGWNCSWRSLSEMEHQHNYATTAGCMKFGSNYMELCQSGSDMETAAGIMGYAGGSVLQLSDLKNGLQISSNGNITLSPDADSAGSGKNYAFFPGAFQHNTDAHADLGAADRRWKNVYCANGTIQTSDRNRKENIKEIEARYIEMFRKLNPVSYEFIGADHDRVHLGFIAQEVKDAMDHAGITDREFAGYCRNEMEGGEMIHSLRYTEFIALNTKMIQQCMARIEALEKELEEK